mmetsp:Transcript_108279/g.171158  ORF Transcript_108279/g.171158 Transcript_108279/m.171158 type:complete len:324 (-) Transcript_108279:138-1109(-)
MHDASASKSDPIDMSSSASAASACAVFCRFFVCCSNASFLFRAPASTLAWTPALEADSIASSRTSMSVPFIASSRITFSSAQALSLRASTRNTLNLSRARPIVSSGTPDLLAQSSADTRTLISDPRIAFSRLCEVTLRACSFLASSSINFLFLAAAIAATLTPDRVAFSMAISISRLSCPRRASSKARSASTRASRRLASASSLFLRTRAASKVASSTPARSALSSAAFSFATSSPLMANVNASAAKETSCCAHFPSSSCAAASIVSMETPARIAESMAAASASASSPLLAACRARMASRTTSPETSVAPIRASVLAAVRAPP